VSLVTLRVVAVVAACLVLGGAARADTIDQNVRQLGDSSYKVRLAAALALSKSKEARAVIALGDELAHDEESTIRRVCALALAKMIDARTPDDARALGIDALEKAAGADRDQGVRDTAATALKELTPFRKKKAAAEVAAKSDKPEVFVNIDATTDHSKMLPAEAGARLMNVVKKSVERTGYATAWPGGLPTSAELASSHSRAFIVASTVQKIAITKTGRQTEIACTVEIRIAPWSGKDGGERWEANTAASASGSAKAMTGNADREVNGGVRDCLEAVAEDVTSRRVLPFLKQLARAGS
jgi:hypothetical protein